MRQIALALGFFHAALQVGAASAFQHALPCRAPCAHHAACTLLTAMPKSSTRSPAALARHRSVRSLVWATFPARARGWAGTCEGCCCAGIAAGHAPPPPPPRAYPFSAGDLLCCGQLAANYLEQGGRVPWEDLRYLFGEIMYGECFFLGGGGGWWGAGGGREGDWGGGTRVFWRQLLGARGAPMPSPSPSAQHLPALPAPHPTHPSSLVFRV